jgi:AcrR family transcriptional regulator
MKELLSQLQIKVPAKLYIKDPESSALGKKMVSQGIELIAELGFEAFTFKKLGAKIGSPESTIYRYFENKHKLLLYLSSWYWAWLEYKVVFATVNINSPTKQLTQALKALCETVKQDQKYDHINEEKLQQIIISESSKAFFTKEVDQENKDGYFVSYKNLCLRLVNIISKVKPNYNYSHTLVSTLLEGIHLQKFYSEHFPALTNVGQNDDHNVEQFFESMILSMLKNG